MMKVSFAQGRWSVCSLLTALGLLLLCSLVPVFAQDATGRIIGLVTDPSGSVIPHAKITVTNTKTNVSNVTTSSDDGSYQALLLPIGSYRVTAEAQGFRKAVTSAQTLEINQSMKVDLKLEIGSTTETVQVESIASGVETTSATVSNTVTQEQIATAPLNGRDVMALAFMMPGVTPTTENVPGTAGAAGTFSINGARPDSITYLLDGGVNNDLLNNGLVLNPNPDAIEEFRILVNNYSAEYGRNGGGVVSVVTRSGTNTFHGSAFDYLRNGDLNANTFFNNQQGLPIDPLKRNQFGATIGGPIWIPKLINGKNRLFFFVAYEGQRQTDLAATSKTAVFTPAELTGDFSHGNASGTGPDPLVSSFLQQYPFFQPNPGLAAQAIISPTAINSASAAYIKAGLIPSSPAGSEVFQGAALNNADELTEKVDYVVTQNDRLTVTLGSNRNPQLDPFDGGNVPGFPNTNGDNHYSGTVAYVKTFSPKLINEFRFNAQRNNNQQEIPASKLPTATQLGITAVDDNPIGPPSISLNGAFQAGFSPQGPTHLIDNTYNYTDSLTWIHGNHSIKMGFNYTPFQNNTVYDFYVTGTYFYYGTGGGSYSQNPLADFLTGLPDEYFQAPQAPSNVRTHNVGSYIQDEWKARKNLTVSLGVRYEYSSPKYDTEGREFSVIPGDQSTRFPNAPPGLVFPGDPGAPKGTNFPDRTNFAPRFGIAWDPFGDGKTSIRTGFGMFYDILKAEDSLQFNGQEPFFSESDLFFNPLATNPASAPTNFTDPFGTLGLTNPFPSKPPTAATNWVNSGFLPVGGGGVFVVNPHLKTPYIYQYNFSIQRELAKNTTLTASYLGSDSHKLTGLDDENPIMLGTNQRVLNAQPDVANFCAGQGLVCPFNYLDEFQNNGAAHYNALAIGLNRRVSDMRYVGSLQYQVSYTRSKSLDNESGFRSAQSQVPTANWNQFWGPSSYNVPNTFAASAVWTLPFDQAWSSAPKALTKGWELIPVFNYRSGLPLNVQAGLSTSPTNPGPSGYGDAGIVQADLVTSSVQQYDPKMFQSVGGGPTGNYFFNPADFSNTALQAINTIGDPGASSYGNLGKNAFRGPDLVNVNLSLLKTIAIREHARVVIGADFFNLLNHTQFTGVSTNITSSLFGQATSTNAARIIQLSARFSF
ncbi:MAG: carboxypeptidase regulatory-like domain-containing protein [Bryobacteraceae bacterium]